MPTSDALTGLGMPAQQATRLGGNPSKVTCVGTAQVGAAKILTKNVELVTAGGATAAVMPSTAEVMEEYFVNCPTATSGLVYPPVGHYMNGSQNASLTIAQNKAAIIWQYKPSYWVSVLTA